MRWDSNSLCRAAPLLALVLVLAAVNTARADIDFVASLNGHAGRGDLLEVAAQLKKGADPNAADRRGRTALHNAARGGSLPVMRLLISRGADIHAKDATGANAVTYAAESPNAEAVRFLLDAGATPDARALEAACTRGRKDSIVLLLDAGLPRNAGMLAAAGGGHGEVVQLLLESGASASEPKS
jgi:ankyrin repeat protein